MSESIIPTTPAEFGWKAVTTAPGASAAGQLQESRRRGEAFRLPRLDRAQGHAKRPGGLRP